MYTRKYSRNFKWEYLETTPSDLLIFDSFIPHKSEKIILIIQEVLCILHLIN